MARLRVQPAKSIANRAQLRCCIGRSPSISDVAQNMIFCPREGRDRRIRRRVSLGDPSDVGLNLLAEVRDIDFNILILNDIYPNRTTEHAIDAFGVDGINCRASKGW